MQCIARAALAALLLSSAALPAGAITLTFDDFSAQTDISTYNGFVFSVTNTVVNITTHGKGPAPSGDWGILNNLGGVGIITKVGGGTFSFDSTYIRMWGQTQAPGNQATLIGRLGGSQVARVDFNAQLAWQQVLGSSDPGFAHIDRLEIYYPFDPIFGDAHILDSIVLDGTSDGPSGVPESSGLMLVPALLGLAGVRRRA